MSKIFSFVNISLVIYDLQECTISQIKVRNILKIFVSYIFDFWLQSIFYTIGSNEVWLTSLSTFQAKRPRVLSDSDGDGDSPAQHQGSNNGYGFGGMPSPDVVQTRLELLQKSFPNKVSIHIHTLCFIRNVYQERFYSTS